jgi:hypothetical protein
MSAQNRRSLLAVFVTVLIVLEMVAYVATTPRPREQFFQIYVLGSNRLAADYYPNDDPNIRPGDQVHWYVGATDFMGTVQLVAIRVRLGNQTINPPDDQQALPSPAPMVTEFRRFIQNNETWEFPFVWQIVDARVAGDSVYISEFQINNQTYTLQDSSALNGHNFRVIIELWTWDADNAALQFGWQSGTERRVAWLQVWFNATSSPPLV